MKREEFIDDVDHDIRRQGTMIDLLYNFLETQCQVCVWEILVE